MNWILAVLIPGGLELPAELDPAQAARKPAAASPAFLDWGRLEVEGRGGLVFFSEDFEADAEAAAGLFLRAPMPWLSPKGGDRFGLYASLTATAVDRDLDYLEETSGTLIFAGAGLDLALWTGASGRLAAQAGFQYESFGGVTDLDDGFATTLGLAGALNLGRGFRFTFNPQLYLADAGDWIGGGFLGLAWDF